MHSAIQSKTTQETESDLVSSILRSMASPYDWDIINSNSIDTLRHNSNKLEIELTTSRLNSGLIHIDQLSLSIEINGKQEKIELSQYGKVCLTSSCLRLLDKLKISDEKVNKFKALETLNKINKEYDNE